MVIKKLIALFFMILVIVVLFLLGGTAFLRFSYTLLVFGLTITMSFVALRPSEIFKSIFMGSNTGLNNITIDFLSNSFMLAGSIGTLISLILLLANLESPDMLIPGFASAAVFIAYGFTLKIIADSFRISSDLETKIIVDPLNREGVSRVLAVLGIVFFVFVIVFSMFLDASPMLFVNVPSFMISICGGFSAAIATCSLKEIKDSFKGGFGGIYENLDQARNAVRVTSKLYNGFIAFGIIGLIWGVLIMLFNISDPDALGPGMAVALITVFYSLSVGVVVLSFGTAARRQVNWYGEDEKPNLYISPVAAGLSALLVMLISFSLLLVSFIQIRG